MKKKPMTTLEFCKHFSKMDVYAKMESIKKLNLAIETKKRPTGKPVTDDELKALKQLVAWAGMNVFIGGELCPPETYNKY